MEKLTTESGIRQWQQICSSSGWSCLGLVGGSIKLNLRGGVLGSLQAYNKRRGYDRIVLYLARKVRYGRFRISLARRITVSVAISLELLHLRAAA